MSPPWKSSEAWASCRNLSQHSFFAWDKERNMSLDVTSLDWPFIFFRRFSASKFRKDNTWFFPSKEKGRDSPFTRLWSISARGDRTDGCTQTGYVDLRILHGLPFDARGRAVCPVRVSIDLRCELCGWLERVDELRVDLRGCLTHWRQTGADFCPQLPAGPDVLLVFEVFDHPGSLNWVTTEELAWSELALAGWCLWVVQQ